MFRIVRTRTLNALRTDLATAQAGAEATSKEAGAWHRLYKETDNKWAARFEGMLADLARAHADRIAAERERAEARQTLADLESAADIASRARVLLEELRAAAHNPDGGTEVQGRIALELVRRALEEAARRDPWSDPVARYLTAVLAPHSTEEDVLRALQDTPSSAH